MDNSGSESVVHYSVKYEFVDAKGHRVVHDQDLNSKRFFDTLRCGDTIEVLYELVPGGNSYPVNQVRSGQVRYEDQWSHFSNNFYFLDCNGGVFYTEIIKKRLCTALIGSPGGFSPSAPTAPRMRVRTGHVLRDLKDHRKMATFNAGYTTYGETHGVDVCAYVLMTNHAHILATPQRKDRISKTMQSLGRRYVRSFNASYHRTGTLWEGPYKSCLAEQEKYPFLRYRNIELNPARAAMAEDP